MGVPTSEVGYTPVMPRREDHEVRKDMWWHWTKKIRIFYVPKREHAQTRKDLRRVGISTREHFRIVCVPNQDLNHNPSEYKAETLFLCLGNFLCVTNFMWQ